jgi:SMI1/KNR4 family protein
MIYGNFLKELTDYFDNNPILKGIATTEQELRLIEKELNVSIDDDFKFFTTIFGGCLIKNSQVYGFHNSVFLGDDSIIDLNIGFSCFLENYKNTIIIGTDGWGNPVFINHEYKVLMFDHDENEEVLIADSFSLYLEKCLRGEGCQA